MRVSCTTVDINPRLWSDAIKWPVSITSFEGINSINFWTYLVSATDLESIVGPIT